ncbi:F0F1 ATP synthase subunit delta [Isoptericola sp. b441]|uniref:ATP synthase subunit delta n=1 Tax=Actinotalea lenta TaxID=3064654 RepID=A0ABT9DBL4_9CELL|nr:MULTISPECIES: F0F1 ATP synthase subunit delta [unclassified Isoptericola]MDO8108272.1 F0F1 ATP synthase subunit delta [Isoptericola sp. b441]MDO8120054.1 F0F1 ATP synthase subunit delta [Isoptericola sp. b490]
MRGTSAASLEAVQEGFEPVLRSAEQQAAVLGAQLFAVVDALIASASLRRAMSDPARSGEDKAGLVRSLLGAADERTADVVAELARRRWSDDEDLVDAVEELAADAVLASAQDAGRLEVVEDELFRFERLLVSEREVRRALVDQGAPAESRAQLARSLLDGKVEPTTVQLVARAAFCPRGRTMVRMLRRLIRLAARRRQMLVASVTAATALSDAQRSRLAELLQRSYGSKVHLTVAVDPQVIGGLRIQVGSQVVDSTVLSRLDDVRRRLAG